MEIKRFLSPKKGEVMVKITIEENGLIETFNTEHYIIGVIDEEKDEVTVTMSGDDLFIGYLNTIIQKDVLNYIK